jgi:hypothetical protein
MLRAGRAVLPIWTLSLIASLPVAAAEQAPVSDSASAKAVASEPTDRPKKSGPSALSAPANKTGASSQAPSEAATPVVEAKDKMPDSVKSPSILQMLEGHETELMIAAAIAVAFFFIGWICGGNYYLRRDRMRRRKIRF